MTATPNNGSGGVLRSRDGTEIAYDRQGAGPTLVLVGGAFTDRSENTPLADELAARFTVYNDDRRGRGASGDTAPYAVDRELEDIEALLAEAGGSRPAFLYGVSSGGALALRTAAAGVGIDALAVYEVPYTMDEDAPRQQRTYVEHLERLLAEGRRGDAAALFMRTAGATDEMVENARLSPMWPSLEKLAPSLAYDAACLGDGRPPYEELGRITVPTLVATGAPEPGTAPVESGDFFDRAADALVAEIPNAERRVLDGQTHMVDPKALAPVLTEFFDRTAGGTTAN